MPSTLIVERMDNSSRFLRPGKLSDFCLKDTINLLKSHTLSEDLQSFAEVFLAYLISLPRIF